MYGILLFNIKHLYRVDERSGLKTPRQPAQQGAPTSKAYALDDEVIRGLTPTFIVS